MIARSMICRLFRWIVEYICTVKQAVAEQGFHLTETVIAHDAWKAAKRQTITQLSLN